MTCAADNNKACHTADSAGNGHGTDNYSFYTDSRISCCILTFTYDCNLIALLAVFQVNKHHNCKYKNDQDIPSVFLSEKFRKPACLSGLINNSHRIGALGILPEHNAERNDLHSNIIQHQSKQCFVCIPVCFEHSGNHSPDHSAKRAAYKHYNKKEYRRHAVPCIDHHSCRTGSAYQNLTFCTDIPETHFKCRSQTDCNTQKNHRITKSDPYTAFRT